MQKLWTEDDGVLSFEWVLLITLLAVGIVGGIAGARDAIIDELGDAAQAMVALDQSYRIDAPLTIVAHAGNSNNAADSEFVDGAVYEDCDRSGVPGQITFIFDIP